MIRVEIQDNLAIEEERLARVQRFKDLDGLSGDDYQYMLSEEQRISENIQRLKNVLSKPPLGVMPRRIWEDKKIQERTKELQDAIKRYVDAGLSYPREWKNELEEYSCRGYQEGV